MPHIEIMNFCQNQWPLLHMQYTKWVKPCLACQTLTKLDGIVIFIIFFTCLSCTVNVALKVGKWGWVGGRVHG
jgi:hypothetical protein